jgi:hypothetical protein
MLTMADALLQVQLPTETIAYLEQIARQQARTVDEVIRDIILQELPGLPLLPEDVEAELAAFEYLSDDALRHLAVATLSPEQQHELAALNDAAQKRSLTEQERKRQQDLVDAYDRYLVRRAQAASILKTRGHDLSGITTRYSS